MYPCYNAAMVTMRDLTVQRSAILDIAYSHGATNVRVFGSIARAQATPCSDVDIIVKLASGRSLLDLVAIKQDLEDLLGCSVDVLTEASVSPYLKDTILGEAVGL